MTECQAFTAKVKEWSRAAGFDFCHICPAVEPGGFHRFVEWMERGYDGEMTYLARRRDAYRHPTSVLDGVRSLVVMAKCYATAAPPPVAHGHGRVSCYAWGDMDYHDLLHERMHKLMQQLREARPGIRARGVVDSAPLLEREFAELAGLGWIGKHTLLLRRDAGSYFFLATILTDQELAYDTTPYAPSCGTCTACLDACPTHAFPEPYVLDATRCISYLTIEHRSAIPPALRTAMGDWLFGCDICQEVCPWNRGGRSPEELFRPRQDLYPVNLIELFGLDDDNFRARFRRTPLWRAKRRGLLRNAAIILGNQPTDEGLKALAIGLCDSEALVREASAWALGEYGCWPRARRLLEDRQVREADPQVLESIGQALKKLR